VLGAVGLLRTVLVALAVLQVSAAGQPLRAAGDGVITGQVVDAATGKPVSAAIVSIGGASIGGVSFGGGVSIGSRTLLRVLTAGDGRFMFKDLPAGSFTVIATKGGYAEGASGRRRPGGAPQAVEITPASKSADIVVRIWKYGAIGGTITDEAGEPVVGIGVRLFARARPGETPGSASGSGGTFVSLARPYVASAGPTLTDDRGMYRFGNLTAADYIIIASPPLVSAPRDIFDDIARSGRGNSTTLALAGGANMAESGRQLAASAAPLIVGDAIISIGRGGYVVPPLSGGRLRIYPPTFYPAVTAAPQASTVTLSMGEERTGMDIQLAPAPTARVSGTLVGRDGPADMATLRLVPVGAEGFPTDVVSLTSVTDAAGTFVFAGVPPGQYMLRGTVAQDTVRLPVAVSGDDIEGLTATASPALKITAMLEFDGNAPAPAASPGRGPLGMPAFILDAADAASAPESMQVAIVPDDRGYMIGGYPPGRYRVRVVNSPAGWMFKTAMLNGVDVSETPFEFTKDVSDLTLVFTDRWTGIGGVVQGPDADATSVVAFPADASKWSGDGLAPRRFKSGRTNSRGQFGISSLPPGDYFIAAIPEDQADGWMTPATLDALSRVASQVTILDGEHKTLDLRVRQAGR
jgi:hypothetical protein